MTSQLRIFTIAGLCLLAAVVTQAQGPLPGAKGARVQELAKLPPGIEIAELFVHSTPAGEAPSDARPQRFPSGISKLGLSVELKGSPPAGTEIDYEILTPAGRFELAAAYMSTLRVTDRFLISYDLKPKSGTFPDGPYQLKLLVNAKPVAALNWSVGER